MIIRTPAEYRIMPWANGRGQTTELLREDGPDGLTLRLSIAVVAEDGPFSILQGVDRNLTVISGPGFTLRGKGVVHHATPLMPIAFSGDVAMDATDVKGASEDFNVMTRTGTRPPQVWLPEPGLIAAGTRLFMLAVGTVRVDGNRLAARHLYETTKPAILESGTVIAVRLGSEVAHHITPRLKS
jgi:uncharacterized protein